RTILGLLREATGLDFASYNLSTVGRRLARRMMLRRIEDIEDYVRYFRNHPAERAALGEDILIHVTSFFRDPKAFDALKSEVFPAILHNKEPGEPIRIWVPGCSTGEEVYSIAIALVEFLGPIRSHRIQIFGS